VAALVSNVDPKLDADDAVAALDSVHERWMSAEKHRTLAESFDARIATLEAELSKDRERIAEAKAAIDRLLALSGASSAAELRRYEEEAREIEALRAARTRLESDLARLGDGQSLAALEAEAAEVASIGLARARIDELDLMLELELSHILIDVGAQHTAQSSKHFSHDDGSNVFEEKPILFIGPKVQVGYAFW